MCVLDFIRAEWFVFFIKSSKQWGIFGTKVRVCHGDILQCVPEGLDHAWSLPKVRAIDKFVAGGFWLPAVMKETTAANTCLWVGAILFDD